MNKKINEFLDACTFAGAICQNYYGEGNEAGYRHDKHTHDTSRSSARNILARLENITEQEFINASKEAWSGRLEWNGERFDYTPGQFGDLEAPQAMEAVLERIEKNRGLKPEYVITEK